MSDKDPESDKLIAVEDDTQVETSPSVPDELDKKIRLIFPGESINKRLTKIGILSSRALPTFVSDWLISKFSKEDILDTIGLQKFLDNYLPDKSKAEEIKARLMDNRERIKILADFRVTPNVQTGEELLEIPILDISGKQGIVDQHILSKSPELLNGGMWGVGELIWIQPERKNDGKIALKEFTPFRPYRPNLDYYCKARLKFSNVLEWIDFLIKNMEYNPNSFDKISQKLSMIARLLPFVEPRVNLIELAPKGTGKSYVYGRTSKYGWLISGGSVSRAQLFYDINRKRRGIITRFDFVAFDEIQTIKFSSPEEVIGSLKGYLESGNYHVASYHGEADAGLVILGNIPISNQGRPISNNYFESLPNFIQDGAFLDRFHGFIKGWQLPRIKVGSIGTGYALNSEFFSEILHEMRKDTTPAAIVAECIQVPPGADKRDATAVTRLATAFLKLLFPHVRTSKDLNIEEFELYCFRPAYEMRQIIREQLHRIDEEFSESMPELSINKIIP